MYFLGPGFGVSIVFATDTVRTGKVAIPENGVVNLTALALATFLLYTLIYADVFVSLLLSDVSQNNICVGDLNIALLYADVLVSLLLSNVS